MNPDDIHIASRDPDLNMIKGKIAEALLEQLFVSSGYSVFRYGIENTVPGMSKILIGDSSNIAKRIRKTPDFVIRNKEGRLFLIEVKFRRDGQFNPDSEGIHEYPYGDAYFVLFTTESIKCIKCDELKNGEMIKPEDERYLYMFSEFELDKMLVDKFTKIAKDVFDKISKY